MTKRKGNLDRIEAFKRRFESLTSETLRARLNSGLLVKEAQTAIRHLLQERDTPGDRDGEGAKPPSE